MPIETIIIVITFMKKDQVFPEKPLKRINELSKANPKMILKVTKTALKMIEQSTLKKNKSFCDKAAIFPNKKSVKPA